MNRTRRRRRPCCLKYAPDGPAQKDGTVDGCIECHRAKQDNDRLFTGSVGK